MARFKNQDAWSRGRDRSNESLIPIKDDDARNNHGVSDDATIVKTRTYQAQADKVMMTRMTMI